MRRFDAPASGGSPTCHLRWADPLDSKRPDPTPRMPHRKYSQAHFDETAAELRGRLRTCCSGMSEEDFEAMIFEMTRVRLKYHALTGEPERPVRSAGDAGRPEAT